MNRVAVVAEIMIAFGDRTGLTSVRAPRRYLWTDAFAVCNHLALYRHTGAQRWLEGARALIDQVHHVLGRHRPDDSRAGWISGLSEAEGSLHPTIGGLRIGKPLLERRAAEAADARLDWERDGQYYHYLTRWMHALDRAAMALRDAELHRFGVELATAAHAAFAHEMAGEKRVYWKMSIDLSRPVVTSSGQHDPLDGLIAAAALAAHAEGESGAELELKAALPDLADMCSARGWATNDALGLGLLMTDALFLAEPSMAPLVPDTLFSRVLRDAARSLDLLTMGRYLEGRAGDRLAFRELGLSLGLAAAERLDERRQASGLPGGRDSEAALDRLLRHRGLRDRIETFWLDPGNQATDGWTEHEDINTAMLATSLLPDGYLS
jgi:hypothetical protein